MILTDILCICIIFFILVRVPNQYENDFSRNLLKSVSGSSTSPKNIRKQFDLFIWSLILIFLCEYVIYNFIIIK
jgi:hypothetical protein